MVPLSKDDIIKYSKSRNLQIFSTTHIVFFFEMTYNIFRNPDKMYDKQKKR